MAESTNEQISLHFLSDADQGQSLMIIAVTVMPLERNLHHECTTMTSYTPISEIKYSR